MTSAPGLSSLAYLRQLPVNMLKIDGSFVRDILKDPRAESMVQAIAHLARSMNLVTVAEYVETDEIRLRVATLGVDYGQGFAIARPVPMIETIAELPMYAQAKVFALPQPQGGEEIVMSGDDLNVDDLEGDDLNDDETLLDSNDETHRRLEIILGGHDHTESTLYQRKAGGG